MSCHSLMLGALYSVILLPPRSAFAEKKSPAGEVDTKFEAKGDVEGGEVVADAFDGVVGAPEREVVGGEEKGSSYTKAFGKGEGGLLDEVEAIGGGMNSLYKRSFGGCFTGIGVLPCVVLCTEHGGDLGVGSALTRLIESISRGFTS